MSDPRSRQSCIFLAAPYGAAARYLLRTGILGVLQSSGARVVALVPNDEEPYIRAELHERGVEVEPLRTPTEPRGFVWSTLVYLRRNTLGEGITARTLRARYANARRDLAVHHPIAARVLDPVLRVLWRSRSARKLLARLEAAVASPRLHRDHYDRYRPSLVVTASPGWFLEDALVLREAAAEGVRSAALIVAWDNPTSKGYRGAQPDHIVAWSNGMAHDLTEGHDIAPDRIRVGGVPQFDVYSRPSDLTARTQLFGQLGLDPARRLILFAGRSPSTYSHNTTVTKRLALAIEDGELVAPCQIVARPHPIHFRSDHNLPLLEYERLAQSSPHAFIDLPTVTSDLLSCDVPEADYRRLAALLAHCDVLVNAFSTTTLEAFLLDKPVVLVSDQAHVAAGLPDDSPEGRPFHLDTHMEPVVTAGAARVARTFDELVDGVNRYLADPQLDSDARRQVVEREVGPLRGQAGTRVGSLLMEFLWSSGGSPAPAHPFALPPQAGPGQPRKDWTEETGHPL